MMETERFIHSFRNGDQEAFRTIYDGYFEALCRYAVSHSVSGEEAADIVQDTFASLWVLCADFHSPSGIRSFLYVTVRNKAINLIRRKCMIDRNRDQLVEEWNRAQESYTVIEAEVARQLNASLDLLPDKCRTVLKMSLEGNSYQEIGERMNVSVHTIRNQRARAIKLLKIFHQHLNLKKL
ncbi:MAG: sigma-70 family RNA polymerase sigma factor [Rikenellaceae bacterium]|nr:sigma-70 family RNA polymerase sigma factor [Rikenellaceae bacterium]